MSAGPSRRAVLAGLGAAGLAAPARATGAPARVAVVGGGFAGATAARALARAGLAVTLVEANPRYAACPTSNAVVAGLRPMAAGLFGYEGARRDGVAVVHALAVGVDHGRREVRLADGAAVPYDRLVLAPGIDLRFEAVPGHSEEGALLMPHAWRAGAQTLLLRDRLAAMDDGGLVVMTAPANPYRCPPGPYERASLIAHFLKANKPRSKLILLDAKDAFSKQRLFQEAWAEHYPDHIEYVPLSAGGAVAAVEPGAGVVATDFARYAAAVANVIPPQRAGGIARLAGAADASGWCPIDPATFESRLVPGVHVVGDAAVTGALPKSAFAANAGAKALAAALLARLEGRAPPEPRLVNACYSLVAPGRAISVAGVYRPAGGAFADVAGAGGTSPPGAGPEVREAEARHADDWFAATTAEVFG